jgi:hypothetical protein
MPTRLLNSVISRIRLGLALARKAGHRLSRVIPPFKAKGGNCAICGIVRIRGGVPLRAHALAAALMSRLEGVAQWLNWIRH